MSSGSNENFSITHIKKGRHPRVPFFEMKNTVLGKSYVLSLVFADSSLIKKLNKIYKNKKKETDVLSFRLGKREGEIFLNLKYAKRKASSQGRNYENFVGFLFIHSLMHLKGFTHSSRMEAQEVRVRRKFGI
jgi:probable rRNA maturation factor